MFTLHALMRLIKLISNIYFVTRYEINFYRVHSVVFFWQVVSGVMSLKLRSLVIALRLCFRFPGLLIELLTYSF